MRLEEYVQYILILKWFGLFWSDAKKLCDCERLTLSLLGRQVGQPQDVSSRQQQGLERPGGPVGDHGQPIRALHHHSHLVGVSESRRASGVTARPNGIVLCLQWCITASVVEPSATPLPPLPLPPRPPCRPLPFPEQQLMLQQGVQLSSA